MFFLMALATAVTMISISSSDTVRQGTKYKVVFMPGRLVLVLPTITFSAKMLPVSYPKLKLKGFLLRRGSLDILKDIKSYILSTGLRSRSSYGT